MVFSNTIANNKIVGVKNTDRCLKRRMFLIKLLVNSYIFGRNTIHEHATSIIGNLANTPLF